MSGESAAGEGAQVEVELSGRERYQRDKEQSNTFSRNAGHPEEMWQVEFLNNLHNRLPITPPEDDDIKEFSHNHRMIMEGRGRLDKKFKDIHPDPRGNSLTYLNQTPREFFQAIDQALATEGVNVEDLTAANDRNDRRAMYENIDPVIIRLYEMGYNHTDLTS